MIFEILESEVEETETTDSGDELRVRSSGDDIYEIWA
jgi:hypothetical protein